jgi:uncharacterized protein (DUF2147 family)
MKIGTMKSMPAKFFTAAMFGLICMSGVALADSTEGTWLSEDGGTKVHLSNCGGGKLCGTVVWLQEPTDEKTGKPKTDKLNPDQSKRARPLIGLRVVQGLAPNGPDNWSGQIYNADDGRTYQASMKVQSPQTVRVQGCVLGILCKNQIWTRAK